MKGEEAAALERKGVLKTTRLATSNDKQPCIPRGASARGESL